MSGEGAFINSWIAKFATQIINPLLLLLFAVTILVFIYGVWEYFFNESDSTDRKKGANHILWGLVGFVIMLGAMGIVRFALNTTGTSNEFDTQYKTRPVPKVKTDLNLLGR